MVASRRVKAIVIVMSSRDRTLIRFRMRNSKLDVLPYFKSGSMAVDRWFDAFLRLGAGVKGFEM